MKKGKPYSNREVVCPEGILPADLEKTTKVIKDWKELAEIPNESNTHTLEVDLEFGCAWIKIKKSAKEHEGSFVLKNSLGGNFYLNTHSFDKGFCEEASKILQVCGFNVEIVERQ